MATATATMQKLMLDPGVEHMISLRYPTPKIYDSKFPGGAPQAFYSLVDGRAMYVDVAVSRQIDALQLGNAEPFIICKERGRGVKVWLSPEGERIRAMGGPVDSQLEADLQASLIQAHARQTAQQQPPLASQPRSATPINRTHVAAAPVETSWANFLLQTTNAMVDVYAAACRHADDAGVPHAAVRTLLLSAYINQSKRGGA